MECDSIWKIRFSPSQPGNWSYTIVSADDQLDAEDNDGIFECAAATETDIEENPNFRGFLKVSSNKRHLTYADGTPFFWLGGTVWDGNSKNMALNGDYLTYLDDRKEKNFTVIQFLVWENNTGGSRNTGTNEAGNMFVKTWDEINVAAAQNLDQRIKLIIDRGMVPCIFFHWGRELDSTNARRNPYYRHLIARLQAYNVLWCVSGEYDYGSKENARAAGNYIDSIDGTNHLITIHPGPNEGNWSSLEDFKDDSWIDFHMLQIWWQNIAQHTINNYYLLRDKGPAKPLVFSEGNYDDPNADQSRQRRTAWQTILNGSFGFTYGCFHVWNWNEGGNGLAALNIPGCLQTTYMGNFMRTLAWHKLVPGREAGIGGVKNSAYSNEDIVVFFESGVSGYINTFPFNGKASMRWLNAVDGTVEQMDSIEAGGLVKLSSPFGINDAVLHLHGTCTENVAPKAPANLDAKVSPSDSVEITWADNADNEAGFKIEQKAGSTGTYKQMAIVAPNTTRYMGKKQTVGTIYNYRISAFNCANSSAYANEVSLTAENTVNTGQDERLQSLRIYPNPASGGDVSFSLDHGPDAMLTIVNLQGKEILKTALAGGQTLSLPQQWLGKGMYIYQLTGTFGTQCTRFWFNNIFLKIIPPPLPPATIG
ncbi:MAG: DUF4038 domain-containing protein [Bacteroidales bacterium]|nr:DUF4038 domain-containing protein [Bacteroidales bacterium]